ncbi:MAG: DUF4838 domain-containing protein [Kiritimatiellae bacterium]|nr:DUF4838 domain-containing protein [Kiritimatiellia bacterium]
MARTGLAADKPAWIATSSNPPVVVITCENQIPEPVAFAAAELRRYLEQILNTRLPVDAGVANAPQIQLSLRPDLALTDEGYELGGEGTVYHVRGGGPLGVVFGVYEFLRRCGGCQFSDLGPDGEYVPRRDRIEAITGAVQRKPRLWYRGLQQFFKIDAELARQQIDWMAKNGLNYVMYTPGNCGKEWFEQELLPFIRQRGLKLDMNHHNLRYWLPPKQYLKEHPEWYAEVDGQRGKNFNQLCICTSNKEAVDTLIANVRRYLRENPEVKLAGIIVEDGFGMCQCEQCVSQDENQQDAFRKDRGKGTENRSKSRRYAKLLNAVARAIRGEFPDVTVGGAAYVDMLWPPRDVKLDSSLMLWIALYGRDGCRPIAPDHTSPTNIRFFDAIRQWKKSFSGRLTVYEYYMGFYAQRSLPYPQWEVICEDWKYLKSLGVSGATIQCEASCHSVYAPNLLAFARCGWDDNVDREKVLDDYLRGAYGSVAAEIRPIFAGMIQTMRHIADGKDALTADAFNSSLFLADAKRAVIRQSLNLAQQKVGNERERRQVQRLSAAVRYWELAADFFELRKQFNKLKKSNSQDALVLADKLVNLASELHEYLKTSMPPGWMYEGQSLCDSFLKDADTIKKDAELLRSELLANP